MMSWTSVWELRIVLIYIYFTNGRKQIKILPEDHHREKTPTNYTPTIILDSYYLLVMT